METQRSNLKKQEFDRTHRETVLIGKVMANIKNTHGYYR